MILVSLPYDGGIAEVYRDDEGTWLDGTLLDQRPGREGVGGGRWAVGGVLPPGASRAPSSRVRRRRPVVARGWP
jgi:hypothetical protein